MKGTTIFFLFILLITTGCKRQNQTADDLITVDVSDKSYPEKELILQDFMDVEYIPLETNEEYINQGYVQTIGKKTIVVKNRNNDGDIFIYDKSGKALRKINRKGQGAEEYTNILGIALDEDNNEMFVNNHMARNILVYDLSGKYKRTLKHQTADSFYSDIFNYDKNNLICYDMLNEKSPFITISKKDGSITREFKIPFKEKKMAMASKKDEKTGLINTITPGYYRTIIPFQDKWMFLELSSDTVYQLSQNDSLRPFLVRNPPVSTMHPETFLMLRLLSDHYIFMECIKNVWDFENSRGFQRTFFMYDRQANEFFKYKVYNGDYSSKKEIYMNFLRPVDGQIESWQEIDASSLIEAHQKGQLKGKLKDIAATLADDDNPVIMLVKHKK